MTMIATVAKAATKTIDSPARFTHGRKGKLRGADSVIISTKPQLGTSFATGGKGCHGWQDRRYGPQNPGHRRRPGDPRPPPGSPETHEIRRRAGRRRAHRLGKAATERSLRFDPPRPDDAQSEWIRIHRNGGEGVPEGSPAHHRFHRRRQTWSGQDSHRHNLQFDPQAVRSREVHRDDQRLPRAYAWNDLGNGESGIGNRSRTFHPTPDSRIPIPF